MPRAEAKYTLTAEDRTGAAFQSVKAKFATAARTAAKTAGVIGVGLAGSFAAAARQAINAGDETTKMARQLDVSTANLAEMRGVLDLIGGDFNAYQNSLAKTQQQLVELREGNKTAVEAFERLGLAADDFAGMNTEQAFELITRAMNETEDATTRNGTAMELYGRRNATTVLRIAENVEQVKELREEQRRLGNTLSEDTGRKMEAFNDAIARLGMALNGAVSKVLVENMDTFLQLAESLARVAPMIANGFAKVAGFVNAIGDFLGASGAFLVQLLSGNFSGAMAVQRSYYGGDESNTPMVEEQRKTNAALERISREGMVGRAG